MAGRVMNRIDEIRRMLNSPTKAQLAWASLASTEKKHFINLAGLQAYESVLLGDQFDKFPENFRNKISKAIRTVLTIAEKFNAKITPSKAEDKKLKAVA